MARQLNRRNWLGTAALTTAATVSCVGAAITARPVAAVEPIRRQYGSKYKFTLAGYSYRRQLTGETPELTLEDFVRECARFGLEGTEPTSYYFPKPVTNEYLCRLKGLAYQLGLSISATAVGNNFCVPPGEARERQLASVKEWIDHAAVLGAPAIRIFSGSVGRDQSLEEAQRLTVEAIEQCCDYAGQRGIFLGLENHGGLTASAESMLKIINAVKSPWFGAWMDTGNFHGPDPYVELEAIAPYTIYVQIKVFTSAQGQGRLPSDYPRLARILGKAGYRGWICLEYEEDEDPRTAAPTHLAGIREAFDKE